MTSRTIAIAAVVVFARIVAVPVHAADAPAATTDHTEQAYEQAIAKRADDILTALGNLNDPAKSSHVRETILAQYRALRSWHDAHDAELKRLSREPAETAKPKANAIEATLKTVHDDFLKRLSQDLTAEQVETVKDKLTYNVVHLTYNAFCDMLPTLTDEQKTYILKTLKDAREEAMDAGSAKEKHAVFGRYKGRINIYLTKQGYDLKKAGKEWQERIKAAKHKRSGGEAASTSIDAGSRQGK